MGGFKDLVAYKKAFELSTRIFKLSKRFPKEEMYSLTDQVRRSSRSVTAQLAEGYRKRRYPLSFIAKVVDADGENAETQVWLDHAVACEYVTQADIDPLACPKRSAVYLPIWSTIPPNTEPLNANQDL